MVCGSLSPLTAYARGLFAQEWLRLARNGRLQGSAHFGAEDRVRGIDVQTYGESYQYACLVSVLMHILPTVLKHSRVFFRYVLSVLRTIKGVGYPVGVAIVEACVGCYVLGSGRKFKRPETHGTHASSRSAIHQNLIFLPEKETREYKYSCTYESVCIVCTPTRVIPK